MELNDVYKPFLAYFRSRRMATFARNFGINGETEVLDVGGLPGIWEMLPVRPRVTFLNVTPEGIQGKQGVVGNGCALPFKDKSFEIVFSNSVIEHVGDLNAQRRFAEECRRVGKRYYVQTPNRWFPVEPHFIAPLIQFVPLRVRPAVAALTPWGLLTRGSRQDREAFVRSIRLLTPNEVQALFPDAKRLDERFLGLRKSLIAARL